MAFTGRYPWVVDAYTQGYTVGFREDGSFQLDGVANVDLPVGFLDNEFRTPDLDRFCERVHQYTPDIAVVGDAYTEEDATAIQAAIDDLPDDILCIAVPKCAEAFEIFDEDVVLGYPNGYSTTDPDEYSTPRSWRGRPAHVLGGSPHQQRAVIEELTQPTLAEDPPADIKGVDGNGILKAAYHGEYWDADGYRRADHLSIRETVSRSLIEIKRFWQSSGCWPDETPLERYGPAVVEPDDPVYAGTGGDIRTREDLERAYIGTYTDCPTLAFETRTEQRFVEYRDGLESINT